jgi:hypothetical protein
MTQSTSNQSDMIAASASILTAEELNSIRLIVDHFESQVRIEAGKHKYGGMSKKQIDELCAELGKLQEIKRKLKLMKGI